MKEDNTFWELNRNWKKLQEQIEANKSDEIPDEEPDGEYHDDNVRATADLQDREDGTGYPETPEEPEQPEETPEQPSETSELKTCGSIFSGIGGWEYAAKQVGLKPIFAFEFHQKYADAYKKSHGDHVTVGDVKLTKGQLGQASVDVLFSSPPCQNYSVAKMNKNDEKADSAKDVGLVTIEIAQKTNAKVILIENVIAYMDSPVLNQIIETLSPKYHTHVQKVYAQEYGCPTSRLRMVATFVRKDLFDGPFIPKPVNSKKDARNWLESIKDLLPTLQPGKLSPWQIERLQRWGTQDLKFPLQISGNNVSATAFKAGKKVRVFRQANEPSFTIVKSWQAMQQTRIMIDENTILKANPHCFARWQSFPDEVFANLPEDPKTATEMIGNAVPPQMAVSILQQII
jgi:site-specific DNA-cytosine methylase